MLDQSSLNLRSRETMAGHVDDIVDTTTDPVVSVVIAACTVSGELGEWESAEGVRIM
jgi:hypothetical protein